MKNFTILFFALFAISIVNGQTYYQSQASGNWSTVATWQTSTDSATWVAATTAPTGSEKIIIQTTHTITVDQPVAISGTVYLLSNGTSASGILSVAAAATITATGTLNIPVATSTSVSPLAITGSGSLFVDGIINNNNPYQAAINGSTVNTLAFNSGSYYNLLANATSTSKLGGQIPAAKWHPNSNLFIGNITTAGNLSAVGAPDVTGFGNLIIDMPNLSKTFKVFKNFPDSTIISGNLILGRTGASSYVQMPSGTNGNKVVVKGNVLVYAGDWVVNNYTNVVWYVMGNIVIDATYSYGTGAVGYTAPKFEIDGNNTAVTGKTTKVFLSGNFVSVAGTNAGTASVQRATFSSTNAVTTIISTLILNGTTAQTVSFDSSRGPINYLITNPAGVTLNSMWPVGAGAYASILPGSFVVESAGKYITGTARTVKVVGTSAVTNIGGLGVDIAAGIDNLDSVYIYRTAGALGAIKAGAYTSINRNWIMSSKKPLTTGRDVMFTWDANDVNGLNLAAAQTYALQASNWIKVGAPQNATTNMAMNTFNSFGQFTIADAANPLPAKLLSFNAAANKLVVVLTWSTLVDAATIKGFEIERMGANNQWVSIGFMNAFAGKSYTFNDANLTAGKYFYRLKQIALDGTITYSDIRGLNLNGSPIKLSVYPNPVVSYTAVETGATLPIAYKVITVDGKLVSTGIITNAKQNISLSLLHTGMYRLQLENGEAVSFIKQ